jgi:hypothetical protein
LSKPYKKKDLLPKSVILSMKMALRIGQTDSYFVPKGQFFDWFFPHYIIHPDYYLDILLTT